MPAELCADESVEDHGVGGPNLGLHGIQVVVPIRGPTGEVKFQRPRGMLLREFILEGLFVLALGFVATDVKEGYGGFFRLGHLADGADIVAEGAILQVGDKLGVGLEVGKPLENVEQLDFFSPIIGLGPDFVEEILQEADGLWQIPRSFMEIHDGMRDILRRPHEGDFVGVLESLKESGPELRGVLCSALHLVKDGFYLLYVFFPVADTEKFLQMFPLLICRKAQFREQGNIGSPHLGIGMNHTAFENRGMGTDTDFFEKVDRYVRSDRGSGEDGGSGHGAFPEPRREGDGVRERLVQKVCGVVQCAFIGAFQKRETEEELGPLEHAGLLIGFLFLKDGGIGAAEVVSSGLGVLFFQDQTKGQAKAGVGAILGIFLDGS